MAGNGSHVDISREEGLAVRGGGEGEEVAGDGGLQAGRWWGRKVVMELAVEWEKCKGEWRTWLRRRWCAGRGWEEGEEEWEVEVMEREVRVEERVEEEEKEVLAVRRGEVERVEGMEDMVAVVEVVEKEGEGGGEGDGGGRRWGGGGDVVVMGGDGGGDKGGSACNEPLVDAGASGGASEEKAGLEVVKVWEGLAVEVRECYT
ncbi:hypothetical protein CYMTET_34355 [Cymbomonas tetramitiformis]|uniref:Uncharacterized protein n=1 Tax=Cymbomonas tetramitiformis TaxID=36881 RepID=A0AAE0FBQ0_9CHLO|nr:hypothetical protein CYMTET_34355 [Cymbomonas tetramitiformis]